MLGNVAAATTSATRQKNASAIVRAVLRFTVVGQTDALYRFWTFIGIVEHLSFGHRPVVTYRGRAEY
jgi:hypothetical protein